MWHEKTPVWLDTVEYTEVSQNRTLERPATNLVAIMCQSEKPAGRGTVQDGITSEH